MEGVESDTHAVNHVAVRDLVIKKEVDDLKNEVPAPNIYFRNALPAEKSFNSTELLTLEKNINLSRVPPTLVPNITAKPSTPRKRNRKRYVYSKPKKRSKKKEPPIIPLLDPLNAYVAQPFRKNKEGNDTDCSSGTIILDDISDDEFSQGAKIVNEAVKEGSVNPPELGKLLISDGMLKVLSNSGKIISPSKNLCKAGTGVGSPTVKGIRYSPLEQKDNVPVSIKKECDEIPECNAKLPILLSLLNKETNIFTEKEKIGDSAMQQCFSFTPPNSDICLSETNKGKKQPTARRGKRRNPPGQLSSRKNTSHLSGDFLTSKESTVFENDSNVFSNLTDFQSEGFPISDLCDNAQLEKPKRRRPTSKRSTLKKKSLKDVYLHSDTTPESIVYQNDNSKLSNLSSDSLISQGFPESHLLDNVQLEKPNRRKPATKRKITNKIISKDVSFSHSDMDVRNLNNLFETLPAETPKRKRTTVKKSVATVKSNQNIDSALIDRNNVVESSLVISVKKELNDSTCPISFSDYTENISVHSNSNLVKNDSDTSKLTDDLNTKNTPSKLQENVPYISMSFEEDLSKKKEMEDNLSLLLTFRNRNSKGRFVKTAKSLQKNTPASKKSKVVVDSIPECSLELSANSCSTHEKQQPEMTIKDLPLTNLQISDKNNPLNSENISGINVLKVKKEIETISNEDVIEQINTTHQQNSCSLVTSIAKSVEHVDPALNETLSCALKNPQASDNMLPPQTLCGTLSNVQIKKEPEDIVEKELVNFSGPAVTTHQLGSLQATDNIFTNRPDTPCLDNSASVSITVPPQSVQKRQTARRGKRRQIPTRQAYNRETTENPADDFVTLDSEVKEIVNCLNKSITEPDKDMQVSQKMTHTDILAPVQSNAHQQVDLIHTITTSSNTISNLQAVNNFVLQKLSNINSPSIKIKKEPEEIIEPVVIVLDDSSEENTTLDEDDQFRKNVGIISKSPIYSTDSNASSVINSCSTRLTGGPVQVPKTPSSVDIFPKPPMQSIASFSDPISIKMEPCSNKNNSGPVILEQHKGTCGNLSQNSPSIPTSLPVSSIHSMMASCIGSNVADIGATIISLASMPVTETTQSINDADKISSPAVDCSADLNRRSISPDLNKSPILPAYVHNLTSGLSRNEKNILPHYIPSVTIKKEMKDNTDVQNVNMLRNRSPPFLNSLNSENFNIQSQLATSANTVLSSNSNLSSIQLNLPGTSREDASLYNVLSIKQEIIDKGYENSCLDIRKSEHSLLSQYAVEHQNTFSSKSAGSIEDDIIFADGVSIESLKSIIGYADTVSGMETKDPSNSNSQFSNGGKDSPFNFDDTPRSSPRLPTLINDSPLLRISDTASPLSKVIENSSESLQTHCSALSASHLEQNVDSFDPQNFIQKDSGTLYAQEGKVGLKHSSEFGDQSLGLLLENTALKLKYAAGLACNSVKDEGDEIFLENYPVVEGEVLCFHRLLLADSAPKLKRKSNKKVRKKYSPEISDTLCLPVPLKVDSSETSLFYCSKEMTDKKIKYERKKLRNLDELKIDKLIETSKPISSSIKKQEFVLESYASPSNAGYFNLEENSLSLQNFDKNENSASETNTINFLKILATLQKKSCKMAKTKNLKTQYFASHSPIPQPGNAENVLDLGQETAFSVEDSIVGNSAISTVPITLVSDPSLEISENSSSKSMPDILSYNSQNNYLQNLNNENLSFPTQHLEDFSLPTNELLYSVIQNSQSTVIPTNDLNYAVPCNEEMMSAVTEHLVDTHSLDHSNKLSSDLVPVNSDEQESLSVRKIAETADIVAESQTTSLPKELSTSNEAVAPNTIVESQEFHEHPVAEAVVSNPTVDKIDVPVTELLKILHTAKSLPSDYESPPPISLQFKETYNYEHGSFQKPLQQNPGYTQDVFSDNRYSNPENYRKEYSFFDDDTTHLQIPIVREYDHKPPADSNSSIFNLAKSKNSFEKYEDINVSDVPTYTKDGNASDSDVDNEFLNNESELLDESGGEDQNTAAGIDEHKEKKQASDKDGESQNLPQYKSRYERIMERKSLESQSKDKGEHKDCLPSKFSKQKPGLSKPIAHVQPCSQNISKKSLNEKEITIHHNSSVHKKTKDCGVVSTKTKKEKTIEKKFKSFSQKPSLKSTETKTKVDKIIIKKKSNPLSEKPALNEAEIKNKEEKIIIKKKKQSLNEAETKDKVKKIVKKKHKSIKISSDDTSTLFSPDKIVKKKDINSSSTSKADDNNASKRLFGRVTNRGSFLTQSSVNQPPKSKAPQGKKSVDKIKGVSKVLTDEFHSMVNTPEIKIAGESDILSKHSRKLSFESYKETNKNILFNDSNRIVNPRVDFSLGSSLFTQKSVISSNILNDLSPDLSFQASSDSSDFFSPPDPFASTNLPNTVLPSFEGNKHCLPRNLISPTCVGSTLQPSLFIKRPLLPDPVSINHALTSSISMRSPLLPDPGIPFSKKEQLWKESQDISNLSQNLPSIDFESEIMSPRFQSPPLANPPATNLNQESSFSNSLRNALAQSFPSSSTLSSRSHHRHSRSRQTKCICLPPRTLKSSVGQAVFETLNVLLLILEWNVDWLVQQQKNHDPPPISNTLKKIDNTYEDIEDYYNTYLPLLLLETWQRIYVSWTHLHQASPYFCEITSYTVETHSINVECQAVFRCSDAERGIFPEEGNIIMVKFGTKEKGGIKILGYVTKVKVKAFDPTNDPQNACYRTLKYTAGEILQRLILTFVGAYTSDDFDKNQLIRIQVLCNIKSTLKQNDAMLYVKNSPLYKNVLNPLNDGLRMVTMVTRNPNPLNANEKVTECVRDIIKGILSPHPLPLLTIAKSLPSSDRLLVLPPLIEKMKHSYKTKVLMCTRTTKALTDIGFNLEGGTVKVVIIGKRADIHQKLRKYLLEDLATNKVNESSSKQIPENTLLDQGAKNEAYENAKIDILRDCDVILSLIRNCHNDFIAKACADGDCIAQMCCIIDEANLCTEPEILIPLLYGISKLILIGDPDVPAKVCSKTAISFEYNRSIFHRAYELDLASE